MSSSDQITSSNHLVVVCSSAGGIEALSVLVSTLPTDFPTDKTTYRGTSEQFCSSLSYRIAHQATRHAPLLRSWISVALS